ncbi:MAG: hypothetical protein ACREUA_03000, partial [Burkholderiales bacterium]
RSLLPSLTPFESLNKQHGDSAFQAALAVHRKHIRSHRGPLRPQEASTLIGENILVHKLLFCTTV